MVEFSWTKIEKQVGHLHRAACTTDLVAANLLLSKKKRPCASLHPKVQAGAGIQKTS